MKRAHVFIHGKVQGVSFRASTKRNADDIGVRGWVRNLSDGRVEAVFEGSEEDIREMLSFCKEGPELAVVDKMDIRWEEPENVDGFEIRR